MVAYRWKGVTRRGAGQPGAMDIAPADLPAWVEARWRALVVTAADDGRNADQAGPADDGGRTWYAATA
jgi:hypothetical protein